MNEIPKGGWTSPRGSNSQPHSCNPDVFDAKTDIRAAKCDVPFKKDLGRDPGGCNRQDEQTLFTVLLPHLKDLRRHLSQMWASNDVEDLIQDVFLRIYCRNSTEAIDHPKAYLYQVAYAVNIDRHRRDKCRLAHKHCELSEEHHPADEISPLRVLLAREDMQTTRQVLKSLPKRTREIFIAKRIEGRTLRALAQCYDISTSAVEKHITRATKALATHHNFINRSWTVPPTAPPL